MNDVPVFWGAEPGTHCPVSVSGSVVFYLELQLLWLEL